MGFNRNANKCDFPFFFALQKKSHTPEYSYETANGITGEEIGTLKKATSPDSSDVITAKGSFSYTAPDGTLITLTYEADDVNGFQPKVHDHFKSSPNPYRTPVGLLFDALSHALRAH